MLAVQDLTCTVGQQDIIQKIIFNKIKLCSIICQFSHYLLFSLTILVKVLDWGEDGLATAAETAALRTSFQQEVAVWHKLDHPNVTKVRITYC